MITFPATGERGQHVPRRLCDFREELQPGRMQFNYKTQASGYNLVHLPTTPVDLLWKCSFILSKHRTLGKKAQGRNSLEGIGDRPGMAQRQRSNSGADLFFLPKYILSIKKETDVVGGICFNILQQKGQKRINKIKVVKIMTVAAYE